ncbi:MAG: sulfur carrier protein ThiS, partial [Pantoea sp.]|nr:sulfur carrier protein ThiS [Pantoea sp.]
AGAGIGTLVLADDDDVHVSNLQRQILFTCDDISRSKAAAARARLARLNPQIELIALKQRLGGEALQDEVAKADVVLDCTDNMATRQAINAACVALALNQCILPRERWEDHLLQEGDQILLFQVIAGG